MNGELVLWIATACLVINAAITVAMAREAQDMRRIAERAEAAANRSLQQARELEAFIASIRADEPHRRGADAL